MSGAGNGDEVARGGRGAFDAASDAVGDAANGAEEEAEREGRIGL